MEKTNGQVAPQWGRKGWNESTYGDVSLSKKWDTGQRNQKDDARVKGAHVIEPHSLQREDGDYSRKLDKWQGLGSSAMSEMCMDTIMQPHHLVNIIPLGKTLVSVITKLSGSLKISCLMYAKEPTSFFLYFYQIIHILVSIQY